MSLGKKRSDSNRKREGFWVEVAVSSPLLTFVGGRDKIGIENWNYEANESSRVREKIQSEKGERERESEQGTEWSVVGAAAVCRIVKRSIHERESLVCMCVSVRGYVELVP